MFRRLTLLTQILKLMTLSHACLHLSYWKGAFRFLPIYEPGRDNFEEYVSTKLT